MLKIYSYIPCRFFYLAVRICVFILLNIIGHYFSWCSLNITVKSYKKYNYSTNGIKSKNEEVKTGISNLKQPKKILIFLYFDQTPFIFSTNYGRNPIEIYVRTKKKIKKQLRNFQTKIWYRKTSLRWAFVIFKNINELFVLILQISRNFATQPT